jgi:cytochrome c-type biogenesis protein CcmH/NrfG
MGPTEFLLVVAVGGGIIAVLVATFKGAAGDAEARAAKADDRGLSGGARAELDERYEAAVCSLEEIEADHDAGNLSDADYGALRGRYETEIAHLERELGIAEAYAGTPRGEAVKSVAAAPERSWVPGAVGWTAAGIAFAALAYLVLSTALRPRVGDDSITGSIPGQGLGASMGVPVGEVDLERLRSLEDIVAGDPQNLEALVELGHMYLRLQRYDELNFVTQAALAIDPNHPEALTHLGMLLFSMDHPEGVLSTFDQALAIDPDFAEALQFKGMVSFMRGDYATAVEAWEHYVEVVPPDESSPRIQALLEAARANLGGGTPE